MPRHESLRCCYRASKLERPKLKIHGAWCFGFNLVIGILEENTTHGSSLVQELLMICIERVMEHCRNSNQPAPDTLAIVGDNTVKELKNSICLGYISNLINHAKLRLLCLPLRSVACFRFLKIKCCLFVNSIISLFSNIGSFSLERNMPHQVWNGHDDESFPYTRCYRPLFWIGSHSVSFVPNATFKGWTKLWKQCEAWTS